jgi:hypothetical protein
MSFIGNLGYIIYYKPKGWLRRTIKNGLFNSLSIEKGRKAMVKASASLQITEPANQVAEVYFLTGKKFWPLTAFCMYSLSKQSGNKLRAVFIDDGSLDDTLIKTMRLQFPGCSIKTSGQIEADIKTHLPVSKYPVINKKRAVYPHIKKLTDVHAGSNGWKLVLDSDMLFFKYPAEMLKWLDTPEKPFFLYDPICSYHYSLKLMEQFAGNTIIPNLNVGAIGLKSELIDWDKLEAWIAQLEEKEGTNYLLEQALSAMLVAGGEPIIANREDYIVMPERSEVEHPAATLHHYVAGSKEWYYKKAWQQVM